jgi:hypothetical protein
VCSRAAQLQAGRSKAVGWKWFPYKGWLELEIWFDHPNSLVPTHRKRRLMRLQVGAFMVVHCHFATEWEQRRSDPQVRGVLWRLTSDLGSATRDGGEHSAHPEQFVVLAQQLRDPDILRGVHD